METKSHHWEEKEGKLMLMLGKKLIAIVKPDSKGTYGVLHPTQFTPVVSGFTRAKAKQIAESLLP